MRGILILGAAASLLAGPVMAQAPTPAQTLKEFGLIGEWSKDCAAPVGDTNTRTIFTVEPDGTARLTLSFGPAGQMIYSVTKARIISRQVIVISEINASGQPADVTVALDGKRTRVIASRDPSINKSFIGGGVLLSSGRETNWESRCR